jgi:hypothetical protein
MSSTDKENPIPKTRVIHRIKKIEQLLTTNSIEHKKLDSKEKVTPSPDKSTFLKEDLPLKTRIIPRIKKIEQPLTTSSIEYKKLDPKEEVILHPNKSTFLEEQPLSSIEYKKSDYRDEVTPPLYKPAFLKEPDPDQKVVIEHCYSQELIVNAGPGSGKTSTLCHIVAKINVERPQERLLVLVYNKKAEELLIKRLERLKCNLIPKTETYNPAYTGVLVLTFDKFAYQVNLEFRNYYYGSNNFYHVKNNDSYHKNLEMAFKNIIKTQLYWHALFLDEAQDMTEEHANLASAIISQNKNGPPRLFIVGDPRQELYTGAVFFSHKWRDSPKECKYVLRYNHRSSPEIVQLLNVYSRANFPILHHDQIATLTTPGKFVVKQEKDARERGKIIGRLLAEGEPGKTYALVPVTVDKYFLESITNMARQTVGDISGIPVNISDNFNNNGYDIATSKKMKGTERDTVIVYGADINYSGTIDNTSLAKLIYVALSRAKHNLYLVVEQNNSPILKDLLSHGGIGEFKEREVLERESLLSIKAAGDKISQIETGLSTCEGIEVSILSKDKTSTLNLPTNSGADFAGIYAEALVTEALGIQLFDSNNIKVIRSEEGMIGPYWSKDSYIIKAPPDKINKIRNIIATCGQLRSNSAFSYATLLYSFKITKLWTLGKDLLRIETNTATKEIASYIRGVVPNFNVQTETIKSLQTEEMPYRRGKTIFNTKDGTGPGKIKYILDIMAAYPIEIKYISSLRNSHRRQAGIYACLTRCPSAMLINVMDGTVEHIAATDYITTINCGRAMLAVQLARARVIQSLREHAITPPQNLIKGCIIVVNIITVGNIIEIGAIAFSATDFTILGVYDKRPSCIREMTCKEIDLLEEGEWFSIEKKTGLVVTCPERLIEESKTLLEDFYDWVESVSSRRTILYWSDNELALLKHLGNTLNLKDEIIIPWLEKNKYAMINPNNLHEIVSLMVPDFRYLCDRAFEECLAIMTVFLASISFEGVL